jgi:hypothetical protein
MEDVNMFPVIGLLAVPALLSAAPEQELTLQQVLKANTAAINAIRSIHVTIEVSSNHPVPKGEELPTEVRPYHTTEWYKDNGRERMREDRLRRDELKPARDASNGPKGYKALHGYDPNNLPSESGAGHGGGELDKTQPDNVLGGFARAYSYMQVGTGGKLEEFVAEHPESKLAATPATSKLGCYEITLVEKIPANSKEDDLRDLRIFVDPKVGFWIRRVERGPSKTSTNPRDKGTFIGEVQEFKDCGNGIFWPLRISQKGRWPGETWGLDTFIRHTLHSINQSLPEEDFEVHFPDWLIVDDNRTGQVFIWGPDDKPRMTFASRVEFDEWDRSRMEAAARTGGVPQPNRRLWVTGISVAVGLLLLALILWRRRIQHAARGMPPSIEKTQGDASVMP